MRDEISIDFERACMMRREAFGESIDMRCTILGSG